jgi:hypothetical protein
VVAVHDVLGGAAWMQGAGSWRRGAGRRGHRARAAGWRHAGSGARLRDRLARALGSMGVEEREGKGKEREATAEGGRERKGVAGGGGGWLGTRGWRLRVSGAGARLVGP